MGLRRNVLSAVAVAASVVTCAAGFAVISPSPAGAQQPTSQSLREKAAKIAERREELQMLISEKDEEYNVARLNLEQLGVVAESTSKELAAAKAEYSGAQHHLHEAVRKKFVNANGQSSMAQGSDVSEALIRRTYLEVGSTLTQDISDQMRAASADLSSREQAVADTTKRIEAEKAKAEQAKKDLAAAEAELQAQQQQVSADLAKALAAEEKARQEAEAAAARAAAKREAEAERARQAAASAAAARSNVTSSSGRNNGGSSGSSSSGSASSSSGSSSSSGLSSGSGSAAPVPQPTNTPPPSSGGSAVVEAALTRVGMPYSWGAEGPNSFDCSGLVIWAFRQAGRGGLPHSSRALYAMGAKISVSSLVPGDLVAYGNPVHHIGIYIGNGQYVHAPHSGDVVKVSSIYRSNGSPRPVRI